VAERLIPGRTEEFEQSRGEAVALGNQTIVTPRGDVLTTDAPGYMTMLVDHREAERRRIAFMLYNPGPSSRTPGTGMIAQMTAAEARTIAASLLRLADRLGQGKAN
jgi:hypothetical protein